MEWLLEDLPGTGGDIGLPWGQLTYVLACRHCGSNTCLQSPGDLVILFLFIVWQVRRWWQLGKWQQLQPWCSGDMIQGKGLPFLYHLAFLNYLWKQKSEEEEEEREGEEESSFDLPKLSSPSKEVPNGKQSTIPPQLSCGSESLPQATETPERITTQSSSPFRSYPTIQILTNFPVRNKTSAGSYLQQKSQLFWGFPSLHSESLETIFLSSDGPSPLKLSICPSVFFNKLAFLPKYNLSLPYYHSPTQFPTHEAHTMEDLEEMAHNSQLVSSPSTPTLSLHNFKPLPMDPKRVLFGAEAETEPQGTSPPVYKAQLGTMGPTSESPQVSKPLTPISCQPPVYLSESQKANPRELSASKDFWETIEYRESPQVSMSPIPAPTLPLDSLLELQKSLLEDPSGDDLWWECRENSGTLWTFEPQALDLNTSVYETSLVCVPSVSATSQKGTQSRENVWVSVEPVSSTSLPSDSLLKFLGVGSQEDLSESKALWKTKEQRENLCVYDFTDSTQRTPVAPFIETKLKGNKHSRNSWASESPSQTLSLPCALALESLRVSPMVILFDSNAKYMDIQTRTNSRASKVLAHSLPQELYGASHIRAGSDSEPVGKDKEQRENYHVLMSPNQPSNSISKSHISEPFGDQSNYKPEGNTVKQTKNCWATDQQAPSSLSATPLKLHTDRKFVQEREVPQDPSLPLLNNLCSISWPPTLTKALKSEPTELEVWKGKIFSETKAKALSSQGEAVLEVLTHPGIHVWQWSRELECRLKRLHQSPFKSSSPNQPCCSFPTLSSTTPDSSESSFYHPQIRRLNLHYSSCHPPKIQSTVLQPVEVPHCHHSHSSQLQLQAPDQGKARVSEKRIKGKMVTQVPAQGPSVHIEADKNNPGLRESSNTGGPASDKRQNQVSALSLAQKAEFLRKPKAGEYGGEKARLGLRKVIGKSHSSQACRVTEAPENRFSQRSQHRDQGSPHTALPQYLVLKDANPQNKRKAGLVTGGIENSHHCKHCPWAHTEKHLPSSISQAPHTRGFQSVLAKFLGIRGPPSPNPVSREKTSSTGT
ncbi:uncharacterized protein C9orf131 homolog [Dipodomys spectabilis]|uniref:uncharacterized protein C9orf131 homolog n=1 Tax=Dipodomys spectabilis TaxID=105255 RepID=UPI001C534F7B|nr:uncharacterized protein C9orf131 homolog [Dipodomys spectabilis]